MHLSIAFICLILCVNSSQPYSFIPKPQYINCQNESALDEFNETSTKIWKIRETYNCSDINSIDQINAKMESEYKLYLWIVLSIIIFILVFVVLLTIICWEFPPCKRGNIFCFMCCICRIGCCLNIYEMYRTQQIICEGKKPL